MGSFMPVRLHVTVTDQASAAASFEEDSSGKDTDVHACAGCRAALIARTLVSEYPASPVPLTSRLMPLSLAMH